MDPIANCLYKTLWFLSALRVSRMTGEASAARMSTLILIAEPMQSSLEEK